LEEILIDSHLEDWLGSGGLQARPTADFGSASGMRATTKKSNKNAKTGNTLRFCLRKLPFFLSRPVSAITDSPKLLRETDQTERYDKGPDRYMRDRTYGKGSSLGRAASSSPFPSCGV